MPPDAFDPIQAGLLHARRLTDSLRREIAKAQRRTLSGRLRQLGEALFPQNGGTADDIADTRITKLLSRLRKLEDELLRALRENRGLPLNSSGAKAPPAEALFARDWYLDRYPDVREANVDPLQHYIEYGAAERRDPHPLFSTAWYLEQNPDVAAAAINPLVHYLAHGGRERRDPSPVFNTSWYLEQLGAEAAEVDNPLLHYLTVGRERGLRQPSRPPAEPDVPPTAPAEPIPAPSVELEVPLPAFHIPRDSMLPASSRNPDVKAIAFYLPQFHRIPQNDEWWGEGFTEWTNVRRGEANFAGHYQPHVPSVLGYYDLTDRTMLERQTQLARAAGIYGFCFYFYWFGGEVLLDLPLREMASPNAPDFPFCICWANENWTRRWDGKENDILIAQHYSPEDDLAFIERIEPILTAKNYIRVDGKPLLLLYRASLLPDVRATLQRWREHFRTRGHGELHIAMVRSFSEHEWIPAFDAAVQFPPHFHATAVTGTISDRHPDFTGTVYDYAEVRRKALEEYRACQDPRLYPGVMPSWDNTARQRRNASIWINPSPEAYAEWLGQVAGLVRVRQHPPHRFVFLNAWNEWAEGCHLEPDERFGFAWLNATSIALRDPSLSSLKPAALLPRPASPEIAPVHVEPMSGRARLVISVLLYHREDTLGTFLSTLFLQMAALRKQPDITCELFLSFNYKPSREALHEVRQRIACHLPLGENHVHIVQNGHNLGFGAGHNATFAKAESDIFIVLNSDLRVDDAHWLAAIVDKFRQTDAAIVGVSENASRLREDACGIQVGAGEAFDYVDASLLAIRSDLARRFGLFSHAFDYFYFEDADLCLRYRQIGLRLDALHLKCHHDRSSSSRLLPQFAIEGVLDRNRARFFARWGKYLETRQLPNRLGVHFPRPDRALQCASLPALVALLAEHPTAVLDVSGVHEQLVPLFRGERIRLIPSWQLLCSDDYLRYYELNDEPQRLAPRLAAIAEQLVTMPDIGAAREHLERVAAPRESAGEGKLALLYLARRAPLFEGAQPDARTFISAEEILRESGFSVLRYTEYSKFEIEEIAGANANEWQFVASSDALSPLADILRAEVVVTTEGWVAELAQLLDRRAFVWLGAVDSPKAVWNEQRTVAFSDEALDCLGCHYRYGRAERNICLRGDIACMRDELAEDFRRTLRAFCRGERIERASATAVARHLNAVADSPQLSLEAWPRSSAADVLVLTPVNPKLGCDLLQQARALAERAVNGMARSRIVYDNLGEAPPRGSTFPHRLAALTPLRQAMVDRHLRDERWVFWVDADIVEYPANLIEELIARAEGGIAAPLVLMEGDRSEPAFSAGFGPGRFYDIAGFVENGRWARFTEPYFDQLGPVYRLDSVGCCYLVNADLYRWGARHELDCAACAFVEENRRWADDAITQNQAGPANCFTDHYTVCQFAWKAGVPVQAFADLIAYHVRP